jgi:hypothetical protein
LPEKGKGKRNKHKQQNEENDAERSKELKYMHDVKQKEM